MTSKAIAIRYAQVLYKLSSSREQLREDFLQFAQLIQSFPKLLDIFLAPQIGVSEKGRLLDRVLAFSQEPLLKRFLFLLIYRGKMKDFSEIFFCFKRMITQNEKVSLVEVKTATSLDKETKEKLKKKLEAFYKKKILLEEEVNPSLIGGLVLICGNQVMDGSVLNSLMKLKESLLWH